MSSRLYVESSPRPTLIEVSRAVAFAVAHPCYTIDRIDIWDLEPAEFDAEAMSARYAGLSRTPIIPSTGRWERMEEFAQPFAPDDNLLRAPLEIRFPHKLEHLIEVISQRASSSTLMVVFSGRLTGQVGCRRLSQLGSERYLEMAEPRRHYPYRCHHR